MDPWNAVILVVGGLVAGFMNTVAGGGSMITLPLLMMTGLGADVANGTNRVAILFQNIAATLGFRHQGIRIARVALVLAVPAGLGALLGAWLAVSLDPETLKRIFGAVLGVLAVFVLVQPKRLEAGAESEPSVAGWSSWCVFFGIGVYGGFVQAGVGFLFLGGLVLWLGYDLVRANAIKVLVVMAYTGCALGVFVWQGKVALLQGLVLALGNTAGGYLASVASVKKGAKWVRMMLVACAVLASVKLLGVI